MATIESYFEFTFEFEIEIHFLNGIIKAHSSLSSSVTAVHCMNSDHSPTAAA